MGVVTLEGATLDVGIKLVQPSDAGGLARLRAFGRLDLAAVDLFTLHWTVTTTAKAAHTVLVRRKLSAHFLMDSDPRATIYQTLDLGQQAGLTKGVNMRSVGVEIANPYDVKYQNRMRPRAVRALGVNGSREQHLDFYAEQKQQAVALADACCTIFRIPRKLPGGAGGKVLTRALTPEELARFKGVIGHYHVAGSGKIDPGLGLWESFERAGYEVVPV